MHHAVQFGAGNIGRGFLGHLLFEGGYHTTFVDTAAPLVAALNARGAYPLRLVSNSEARTLTVGRLTALDAGDLDAVTSAVRNADLVAVAVGVRYLPSVAPVLARGIVARAAAGRGPLNVLLCENQRHAATLMRDLLQPHIRPEAQAYFEHSVGLVETVIGRMTPTPTEALRAEDPLLIVAEPYEELPVDRNGLRGAVPTIPGLIPVERFDALETRKLFLHNMAHAALAYLGSRVGHRLIWQCADDPAVAQVAMSAMTDVSRALVSEYGFDPDALQAHCEDLMRRFGNRALGDTIARVAADPKRKLRPGDRLLGAAALCRKHGIESVALEQVIQAALSYADPAVPSPDLSLHV